MPDPNPFPPNPQQPCENVEQAPEVSAVVPAAEPEAEPETPPESAA